MPRILITTNHLREIRGSELVTLELAEEFLLRGWHVDVYTNLFLPPMADRFAALAQTGDLRVADDPYDDFGIDYDLVWVQHSLLPPSVIRRLAERDARAAVVWHHMSAMVEIELPVLADIEDAFTDIESYVSQRTMELHREFGITTPGMLFPNPVPRRFTEYAVEPPRAAAPDDGPHRIAVISNHPPQEVLEAAALLEGAGVLVDVIGETTEVRDVTPELIASYDGVITIGKTVQYALSVGVPAYVYDHFGGDGWLDADSFEREALTNFSGRATRRRLEGAEIAREVRSGHAAAQRFVRDRLESHRERFALRRHVDDLLAHPAVARPPAKHLSPAESRRWLAHTELVRGMYRTTEYLRDEVARLTIAHAEATTPDEPSPVPEEVADGSVHVLIAATGDASRSARATASVRQQRLRPDHVTTFEAGEPGASGGRLHDVDRFNDLASTVPAEFIAIQDGTGSWHPEFLGAAVAHLALHPEQSAVVARTALTVERTLNGHRIEHEHRSARPAVGSHRETIDVSDQLVENRTPFAAMVFRRSAAVAAGMLDADLRHAADWDFGLRLLHVGPIGVLDASSTLVTLHTHDLAAEAANLGRARTELAAKAMRLDGERRLMYSAVLTSQAATANITRSGDLVGRFDELSRALHAHGADAVGLELRVRRFLRALPARMARRMPSTRGARR
ncbi:hypothetical protein GCM10017608_22320 [Agromyces luteolus]|uniref:Glycosyltransferase n=1 Tax=Agromyces luteolus TaxID=88373 RepID=A0A7C9LW13_9MICO|nr:hypothetical protein [Agromyces luteolus]MUN05977.1 hypothetical protein [Agromyces luteolus]GLK28298.1 hypothetical protein GCM10017608_22320 [Agromyces luteolus]